MNTPFHPILIAIFPILFIFSNNFSHLSLEQIQWPTLWILLVTVTIWYSLSLWTGHGHGGATATSWLLLIFFSYGPIFDFLYQLNWFEVSDWLLLAIWVLLGIAGFLIIFRSKEKLPLFSMAANWVAIILIAPSLVSLVTIPWLGSVSFSMESANANAIESTLPTPHPSQHKPNIFYIVLDAYGGQPALKKYFDFDNQEFIDFLTERGFQVDSQSKANYNQTWLALASSLNLNYVQDLLPRHVLESKSRQPLQELIQKNIVKNYLRKIGYSIVCLQSGLYYTRWDDADTLSPSQKYFDEFLVMWISLTPIKSALTVVGELNGSIQSPYQALRERILHSFEHLPDFANTSQPSFVFAHIVAPHPPFVFGPNGEPIQPDRRYHIGDGSVFFDNGGTKEEYQRDYIGEVKFLNAQLMNAIEKILNEAKEPPIILIQADHGSRLHLDWDDFNNTTTDEAFSIFNALYLPEIYRSKTNTVPTTPVNNFRTLFNILFHTEIEPLEDKSYYSTWENLYQFYPVES